MSTDMSESGKPWELVAAEVTEMAKNLAAELSTLKAENERLMVSLRAIAGASKQEDGCYYTNLHNISVARSALSNVNTGGEDASS